MIEIKDWNDSFDEEAVSIVRNYMSEKYHIKISFRTFIVWKCKTIQNVKFVLGVTCSTGYYSGNGDIFELTLNGDKDELYLDCYTKYDKQIYDLEV